MRSSIALVLKTIVAVGYVVACSAQADTIGISGNTLIYGPEGNDTVSIAATVSGSDLILTGTTATLAIVTPGCVENGANSVRCALADFSTFEAIGSAGNDSFNLVGDTVATTLFGIAGVDTFVLGPSGSVLIYAGSGTTDITGSGSGAVSSLTVNRPQPPANPTISITNLDVGNLNFTNVTAPPATPLPRAVPEPATLALLGLGLAGFGLARRRKSH